MMSRVEEMEFLPLSGRELAEHRMRMERPMVLGEGGDGLAKGVNNGGVVVGQVAGKRRGWGFHPFADAGS